MFPASRYGVKGKRECPGLNSFGMGCGPDLLLAGKKRGAPPAIRRVQKRGSREPLGAISCQRVILFGLHQALGSGLHARAVRP